MTKCKFTYTKNNGLELVCVGHAAEENDDSEICVAVTTLIHTLAQNLLELEDMCEKKEIEIQSGYYRIYVEAIETQFVSGEDGGNTELTGTYDQLEFLFGVILNGIFMLSKVPELEKHITFEVYDERPIPGFLDEEISKGETVLN